MPSPLSTAIELMADVGYKLDMHPIRKYIEANGMTQSGFALQVNCSRSFISMLVTGKAHAGADSMRKMERLTKHGITVQDLSDWDADHPII